MFGAEPALSRSPLPHLQRLDWMLIAVCGFGSSSCQRPPPTHHLHTFHNFISTMGLNVGLNSARLTHLARASTVVQAFRRSSGAVLGAFAGHLFWQSVQTDSNQEEFELRTLKAFRSLQ